MRNWPTPGKPKFPKLDKWLKGNLWWILIIDAVAAGITFGGSSESDSFFSIATRAFVTVFVTGSAIWWSSKNRM